MLAGDHVEDGFVVGREGGVEGGHAGGNRGALLIDGRILVNTGAFTGPDCADQIFLVVGNVQHLAAIGNDLFQVGAVGIHFPEDWGG